VVVQKTDDELLTLFNNHFPLPNQAFCTVFSPSNAVSMKVISVLRMQYFEMGKWLQLKKAGRHVRKIGVPSSYIWEWGVEPWLQDATYQWRVRCLTGFAACARSGRYGRGKQVQVGIVSGVLLAVGKTIALAYAYEGNPVKARGEKALVPRLAEAMDGWRKEDPQTKKKLPVGIDIPEYLASLGMEVEATELVKAIGDSTWIAFYYLLRVGEYTVKGN